MLEVRGYVKSIDKFVYNPEVDFEKGKFDTGLRECCGRATGIVMEDIEYLQPCTGLTDKNDNNIYKDDIAKINNKLYTITYEIGSFMLVKVNEETDMYKEFENCWNDNVYPLSQFYWENNCEDNCIYELEIVGNIHQNKDLTEQV